MIGLADDGTASPSKPVTVGRRTARLKGSFWEVEYTGKNGQKRIATGYSIGRHVSREHVRHLLSELEKAGKRIERPFLESEARR